jgi:hypothetical protein
MQKASCTLKLKLSVIVFILSIINSFFWIIGHSLNVYKYIIVGALFEILWLPMIVFLVLLPFLSIYILIKDKWSLKSLYLYSLLIGISTILFLFFIVKF